MKNSEKVWTKTEGSVVSIGITDELFYIIGTLWVCVPSDKREVVKGGILMHYESVKGLGSIRSPIDGTLEEVNYEVMEKPETIVPTTWLFKVKVKNAL